MYVNLMNVPKGMDMGITKIGWKIGRRSRMSLRITLFTLILVVESF